MFDVAVRDAMERRKVIRMGPTATVARAARQMASRNTGAVMVLEAGTLIGIFTERDVVFRVVAQDRDPAHTMITEVMTRHPHVVAPDRPLGYALLVMHEHHFRHLPVLEDGKLIGVVTSRSAMDPDLEEFTAEASRRAFYRGL
jgi:CBS domain-containing protein